MGKLGARNDEGVEETKGDDALSQDESVIDVKKPKKQLSDKQKEILRLGREKNLKLKHSSLQR
jgi:hypothetical protein